MNKVRGISVFLMVMISYWAGGGDFERGMALGYTLGLAFTCSMVFICEHKGDQDE